MVRVCESNIIFPSSVRPSVCHAISSQTTGRNLTELATQLPFMVRMSESESVILSVRPSIMLLATLVWRFAIARHRLRILVSLCYCVSIILNLSRGTGLQSSTWFTIQYICLTFVLLNKLDATPISNFQPIRLLDPGCRDHFLARFRDILAFFCKKSHQNSRSEKKNRTLNFSHFAPLSSYFAHAVHFETIGLFCLTGF